jgi:hypothetical protein
MLKKSLIIFLIFSSIVGMDSDKKYDKNYIKKYLSSVVESQISEMYAGFTFISVGGDFARNIIKKQGEKRGATRLELEAFEDFKIIHSWYVQADFKKYVEKLTDDAVNQLLKEIDGLNTTNVDDVVRFQNAHYKIETKETAFKRLIQSAHFNKITNRQFGAADTAENLKADILAVAQS